MTKTGFQRVWLPCPVCDRVMPYRRETPVPHGACFACLRLPVFVSRETSGAGRGHRWRVPVRVDRLGVEFVHQGDTVIWLWPWRRASNRHPWLSISFEASFPTLAAIDREWADYFVAARRSAARRDG